jgi:ABC-type transport system involved in cytochrome c biogenesis permease component
MSHGAFAITLAVMVVLLHLFQVDRLSGSVEEFWRRRDETARFSKLFFVLSLLSCLLVLISPLLGVACAVAFFALHLGFSMNEWKR